MAGDVDSRRSFRGCAWDVLVGSTALTACWAAGVAVERFVPASPFPPSVTGMIVLWIGLERGWIPERRIRTVARFLVRYLGLWFVPIGVGIVAYGDVVRAHALAIVVTLGVGTVVTMIVAATAAYLAEPRLGDRLSRTASTASDERT